MKTAIYIVMMAVVGIFTACTLSEFYLEGFVKTAEATSITQTSAVCGGNAVIEKKGSDANVKVTQKGIQYSEYENTWDDNSYVSGGTGEGEFTCTLNGLQSGKKYYIRAFATVSNTYLPSKKTNDSGDPLYANKTHEEVYYGEVKTFTTEKLPPSEMTLPDVKTLRVENLKSTSLNVIIELVSLGGDVSVSDMGVVISSTVTQPTLSMNERIAEGGEKSAVGSFKATFTGLTKSTKYYIRAYATNAKGTAYGAVLEVVTPATTIEVQSGLVAYYTFDNENCNESQGKTEYNGVLQGTETPTFATDIPGNMGKSLQLNKDVYYYVPTSPFAVGTAEYTITVWLKTMSDNNVVIMHQTTSYSPGIKIYGNKILCVQYDYSDYRGSFNSSSTIDFVLNSLLLDGNWHLLTISRKSNVFKLYIDGIYYAQKSYSTTLTANVPLFIGRHFTGKMDNLRVYNREITADEITEIYNARQ